MSETQTEAATGRGKLGMWLFLLTEIMLFGGLFLLYLAYRVGHAAEFEVASRELNRVFGTLNTAILLTSSMFVALAVHTAEHGSPARARLFLGAAILLGLGFLGVKAVEWTEKIRHGLYPSAPHLLELGDGQTLYFGLYWLMTGLHALHVIGGATALAVVSRRLRGAPGEHELVILDNAGLYWHLVDLIWIFLFPLFYLIS